jgi:hypothetical protein
MFLTDNAVRWNSTYAMVRRFLRLLPYYYIAREWCAFQSEEMTQCLSTCIDELSQLRALCALLAPIAKVTVLAQGERYATLKRFPFWISKYYDFTKITKASLRKVLNFFTMS